MNSSNNDIISNVNTGDFVYIKVSDEWIRNNYAEADGIVAQVETEYYEQERQKGIILETCLRYSPDCLFPRCDNNPDYCAVCFKRAQRQRKIRFYLVKWYMYDKKQKKDIQVTEWIEHGNLKERKSK